MDLEKHHPYLQKVLYQSLPLLLRCKESVRHCLSSVSLARCCPNGPSSLLSYIAELYTNSTTTLSSNGVTSAPVEVKRGVKQGDPMSCYLFNGVIDWALSSLDPLLGFPLNSTTKVSHLAFADDILLLSESPDTLQRQAQQTAATPKLNWLR